MSDLLTLELSGTIFDRIDPRVKLFFSIEIIILLTFSDQLIDLLIVGFLPIIVAVMISGIKSIIRQIWGLKWFFVLFIIFGYLLTSALSLQLIGFLILKFMILIVAFTSLSKTTNPDEITEALLKLRLPPQFAWQIGITLRQVYFIYDEIINIRAIHEKKYRNTGIIKGRLGIIPKIITSLYANGIIRAKQFSNTLYARGFERPHREIITFTHDTNRIDIYAFVISLLPIISYILVGSQLFIG